MNTFIDMINKIAWFYYQARINNPIDDDIIIENIDYILDNNLSEEEIDELDYENIILEEVCQNILELSTTSPKEFESLISLLTIYYYFIIAGDEEYFKLCKLNLIEEDYIISDIIDLDKDDLLQLIKDNEYYHLESMVLIILEDYLYYKKDNELNEPIEEFLEWDYFKDIISFNNAQKIYLKYHPNIKAENEAYKRYREKENNLKKLIDIPVKNAYEFIILFLEAKSILQTKQFLQFFLRRELETIIGCDCFKDVLYILLKFYYLYNNDIGLDDFKNITFNIIKDNKKIFNLYKEVYKHFSNFDLNTYYNLLISFSNNEMTNLNNTLKLIKK